MVRVRVGRKLAVVCVCVGVGGRKEVLMTPLPVILILFLVGSGAREDRTLVMKIYQREGDCYPVVRLQTLMSRFSIIQSRGGYVTNHDVGGHRFNSSTSAVVAI